VLGFDFDLFGLVYLHILGGLVVVWCIALLVSIKITATLPHVSRVK
jgi:hypothetical protein